MESIDIWECQYREHGLKSQRRYPNESFLSFLGKNYADLTMEERHQLKFLELGCGSGANLWAVAKEGFQAYGIDSSPTGLDYCRGVLNQWNVNAIIDVGDMTVLSFQDDFFEVVYDVVSMQHLTYAQHLSAWSEAFRCLKPEGRFFSFHLGRNFISPKSKVEMLDPCTVANVPEGYPLANNGPTCFLVNAVVQRDLTRVGFIDLKIENIIRSYCAQTIFLEYLVIVGKKGHNADG
ncbi:MAG: class I SAM-dependent methyltransferase [Acidobacteriia bacterium]|nr:class I SAM-dependent methyltransferase [Terriglobia bacterium]